MIQIPTNYLEIMILSVGWSLLIIMTLLIVQSGIIFFYKLKTTVIGKLIIPTVFGWLFGFFAFIILATAYIMNIEWQLIVIPLFFIFLVLIIVTLLTIQKWEQQAEELLSFYTNLEGLVESKTTEIKKLHDNQLKHEKEIQKVKDQFVFIAAHELSTPVTAIRWSLESALDNKKTKLDSDTLKLMNRMKDSNEKLSKLIDDLLNIARIETGTIKVIPKNIDIVPIVKDTLDEMEAFFKEYNVKVKFKNKTGINALADGERLKQVLINLLSNATKYNVKNGEINLSIKKEEKFVVVNVSDTGIGISKENMKLLFKEFSRIKTSKTKTIPGTGLGLFLCKEIVEKWGGHIYAESEAEKGSTFSFTIPIK